MRYGICIGSTSILIVACVLALSAPVQLQSDEPVWELQIDLRDGSRLIGVPTNHSLAVKSDYGRLEVPLHKIRRADWDEKRPLTRMELVNNDNFTGVVRPDPVELQTVFGRVTVPMKYLRTILVRPKIRLGWLPSTSGLELYYSFDDAVEGFILNEAGDAHPGKREGVFWVERGLRGGAVALNGSTRIEVPHHSDLCPQTLTLAAWLKPQGDQSGYRVIVAKTEASSWNGGYGLVRMPGNDRMVHFFVNGYTNSVANTELPPDAWSHVAGVCDGKYVSIYLNGQLMDRSPLQPGTATNKGLALRHTGLPLYIGSDARGYFWSGLIDELVLYNRPLSDVEVRQLFDAAAPAPLVSAPPRTRTLEGKEEG